MYVLRRCPRERKAVVVLAVLFTSLGYLLAVVVNTTNYQKLDFKEEGNVLFDKGLLPRQANLHTQFRTTSKCIRQLPHCLIIGTARCGTSALMRFMDLHPQLATTSPYYESKFFLHNHTFNLGKEWYRSKMPCSKPWELTIAKTPQYIWSPEAAVRIHTFNRDMRILLIACNPIKQSVSEFVALKTMNELRISSENKMKNITFEKMAINKNTGKINKGWYGFKGAQYAKHVANYLNLFGKNQLYVVDGDELIRQPLEELAKLETFLKIQPWYEKQNLTRNARNERFWCLNEQCLHKNKGRPHPTIDKQVYEELRKYFQPNNQEFYQLVNRTFDWDKDYYW